MHRCCGNSVSNVLATRRSREEPEFELVDAMHDAFRAKEYFDVFVEYAKADEEDILCKITAVNKSSSRAAPIHILPQLWYRNTWSWGYVGERPHITKTGPGAASTSHRHLGERYFYGCAPVQSESGTTFAPPHNDLYTNNDTNNERLFGAANETPYVKDAFHEYIVRGKVDAVNPEHTGTKAAMHFSAVVPPEGSYVVWARFTTVEKSEPFAEFHDVMAVRQAEADQFYSSVQDDSLGDDAKLVQRQAFAGLLWSKQFYHFGVQMWLDGDPAMPKPPASRRSGRNKEWQHLYNCDVLSMPDKWEYPWYAAWDLAFHMIPISLVDPEWSKRQLVLMLREWYTHPSGQLPAYEWNFGDVNPPVHAWAVLRVYKITAKAQGTPDVSFLERCFHKLMLNFTWWVNRKDSSGRNLFEGGFLGLDNIGVFDRSNMPPGMTLDQADGTAWMGMFCLNLLSIAVELAQFNSAYQDVCSKFFEHFVALASAISGVSSVHKERGQTGLWDAETKFFYDVLRPAGGAATGEAQYVRAKSFVGLIPLFAVTTIDEAKLDRMPAFKKRMDWFIRHRSSLVAPLISWFDPKESGRATSGDAHGASTRRRLLSLVTRDKLQDVLRHMLDESKFLSPYGLRSLSREHEAEPYYFESGGISASLKYEPAESSSPMYGGNSNWRGPIWMPVNYLMIEALQQFDHYFGDAVQVECPTGSGKKMPLWDVSIEIGRRLSRLFTKDSSGHRPCNGPHETAKADDFDGLVTFYEFFNPETGAGVGASHQTGWTALVAKILQQQGRHGYAFGAAGESDGAAGAGGPSRR